MAGLREGRIGGQFLIPLLPALVQGCRCSRAGVLGGSSSGRVLYDEAQLWPDGVVFMVFMVFMVVLFLGHGHLDGGVGKALGDRSCGRVVLSGHSTRHLILRHSRWRHHDARDIGHLGRHALWVVQLCEQAPVIGRSWRCGLGRGRR